MAAINSVNFLEEGQNENYRGAAMDKVRNFVISQSQNATNDIPWRLPPMRAIATRLGVSLGTVQTVFRQMDHEGIIQTVPQRASYVRSMINRSKKSVFNIGIDFFEKDLPCVHLLRANLYGGLMEFAMRSKEQIIFHNISHVIQSPGDVSVEKIGKQLDGLILAMKYHVHLFGRNDFTIPMVWLSAPTPIATSNFVCADMHDACRKVGEAFRSSGRKRLLYVVRAGAENSSNTHIGFAGFTSGLKSGSTEHAPLCYLHAFGDRHTFFEQIFSRPNTRPEGIFCETDDIAIQIIDQLNRHNIQIPTDVSIVAGSGLMFDGTEFFTMTRIFQPTADIGYCLVRQIVSLINTNKTTFPAIYLPCHIGGGSTTLPEENQILKISQ